MSEPAQRTGVTGPHCAREGAQGDELARVSKERARDGLAAARRTAPSIVPWAAAAAARAGLTARVKSVLSLRLLEEKIKKKIKGKKISRKKSRTDSDRREGTQPYPNYPPGGPGLCCPCAASARRTQPSILYLHDLPHVQQALLEVLARSHAQAVIARVYKLRRTIVVRKLEYGSRQNNLTNFLTGELFFLAVPRTDAVGFRTLSCSACRGVRNHIRKRHSCCRTAGTA